jgi:hypothetical protein
VHGDLRREHWTSPADLPKLVRRLRQEGNLARRSPYCTDQGDLERARRPPLGLVQWAAHSSMAPQLFKLRETFSVD